MNPALLLDAVIRKVARLHPVLIAIIRPALYPFIRWRLIGIATALRTQCRWLPAISWTDVEKHGRNVVYCIREKSDVFTKQKKVIGVWVVDYNNKTVRIVLDVPKEYQKTGAYF